MHYPRFATADSIIGKELIGESEAMQEIFYKIEKIAPTDANILILGENGTGKDLLQKPFTSNHCGLISLL